MQIGSGVAPFSTKILQFVTETEGTGKQRFVIITLISAPCPSCLLDSQMSDGDIVNMPQYIHVKYSNTNLGGFRSTYSSRSVAIHTRWIY